MGLSAAGMTQDTGEPDMRDAHFFEGLEGCVVDVGEGAAAVLRLVAVEMLHDGFVAEETGEKLINVDGCSHFFSFYGVKIRFFIEISYSCNCFSRNNSVMKRLFLSFSLMLLFANLSAQVQPTWESINQRGYPQWFSDAKLGIFIHWGVYSVPAYASLEGYAEWYYRGLSTNDERKAFQERIYGKDFKYEDFAPMFKAELWDPVEWAELFKKSGAKYVLLVSKHHDGYCLWPSKYAPEWNSVAIGPHRDICGELTEAVRAKGLKMGFYYSLPEWSSKIHPWYVAPDDSIGPYVETHMIPQLKELISAYKPTVLFTDGEWRNTAEQWHARELISWYYNTVGKDAIVNDRWGEGQQHGFRTPEYSAGITLTDRPWAECRGLGRSFGLNRNEPLENYLTSDELIRHFCVLVAAGGGMTLNVGPAADGKIPLCSKSVC